MGRANFINKRYERERLARKKSVTSSEGSDKAHTDLVHGYSDREKSTPVADTESDESEERKEENDHGHGSGSPRKSEAGSNDTISSKSSKSGKSNDKGTGASNNG